MFYGHKMIFTDTKLASQVPIITSFFSFFLAKIKSFYGESEMPQEGT